MVALAGLLLVVLSTSSYRNTGAGDFLLRSPNTTADLVVLEMSEEPVTRVEDATGGAPTTTEVLHLHREEDWPLPAQLDHSARYLSYLPHSGFHNQRIALVNALVLSKMLNRTLLVPAVTIGAVLPWKAAPRLQGDLQKAEASDIASCRGMKDHTIRAQNCGNAWNSIRASWSWLLDAKRISTEHRAITRQHIDREWMKQALNLDDSDIHTFSDPDRYSHQIYDSSTTRSRLEDSRSKFSHRVNLADLHALDDVKLLEWGSLFGAARLVLSLPENLELFRRTERMMAFSEPTLDVASEAIAQRLGGRDSYLAAHLRLGGSHDVFNTNSEALTAGVFEKLCSACGLDAATIATLLQSNRASPSNTSHIPAPLPPPSASSPDFVSSTLSCPHSIYPPSSPLAALNVAVYIATDHSKSDSLNLFRNTFPCLFFFENVKDVAPVERLGRLVGDRTGEPLERFLIPFVEAEVVAKGRVALGTPGSTFSNFATSTLFEAYHSQEP